VGGLKSYLKKGAVFLIGSLILFGALSYFIQINLIDAYYKQILMIICINVILALSTNLIINYTGQLTLGHSAFMAIGAYSAAFIQMKTGIPFLIALIFGGIVAAVFGFLIGLPTLRLKGDYLAITTLGFCQIVVVAIQNISGFRRSAGFGGNSAKDNISMGLLFNDCSNCYLV
jgi:branched-chain amino acid transport system permease protein